MKFIKLFEILVFLFPDVTMIKEDQRLNFLL